MGPDEFHEAYPGASEGGLKDNAYTNLMTAWTLMKARSLLNLLTAEEQKKIKEKTGISDDELNHWNEIARNLNLIIRDNIIAQYDGYFDLKELDWDQYRKKYGNIHRMDRLLKAEGKSADEYKVAKQADTLQIFYNLPEKEVTGILKKLGYKLKEDYIGKNLAYYLQRTSHGSTLSKVVHTQLANMIGDEKLSFELFRDALSSDYNDIQGGTTAEGIHAGVMAGTVLVAIQSYAGVDPRSGKIEINPHLPRHWRSIGFNLLFRNNRYFFKISHREIVVRFEGKSPETTILIRGTEFKLKNKETFKYQYL
jgi:trehalose/maltose hydrolase-like predicted phosphorylase